MIQNTINKAVNTSTGTGPNWAISGIDAAVNRPPPNPQHRGIESHVIGEDDGEKS